MTNMIKRCDLTSLELRQELSQDTRRAIEIVTKEMGIMPVGTFKYRIFKYPGDIDIFEQLGHCCTFNIAKLDAAQKIQSVINDINNAQNVVFTEFKAGYDLRYKVYTGIINDKIEDYNSGLIRRDITNLFKAGLFSIDEFNRLSNLVKDIPNIKDLVKLNEELREYWVVRWNIQEVLQGYKLLRGNYKLYLDSAISQGSVVKLDTIIYIDNRYVEVTNFFLISSLDKYGGKTILSEELGDYGQSLLADVYHYYDINPLKSIKRLWMYLAFKGRICDLSILNSIFSSNIALYSQILSDVEVGINLLAPGKNMSGQFNPKLLFDSLNERLKLLNGLCVNEPLYFNVNSSDFAVIANNLTNLRGCLQNKVNTMTYQWLNDNNIDIFNLIQEPG